VNVPGEDGANFRAVSSGQCATGLDQEFVEVAHRSGRGHVQVALAVRAGAVMRSVPANGAVVAAGASVPFAAAEVGISASLAYRRLKEGWGTRDPAT